jgi:hypothetical protein
VRRRGRVSGDGAVGLAGWLFAELALLLMIIAVGSEGVSPAATPPPAGPTTSTPSPKPTGDAHQTGLRVDTKVFTVHVPPNGAGAVEGFVAGLGQNVGPDERIGLILLFGTPGDGRTGTGVSAQLRDLLVAAAVPGLPRIEQMRTYLGDEGPPGTVEVELFLLTS